MVFIGQASLRRAFGPTTNSPPTGPFKLEMRDSPCTRLHHPVPNAVAVQKDLGMPSTRVPMKDRIIFGETGATECNLVSRNFRSMSYSAAKPKPPCVWRQTLAASHDASA